MLLADDVGFTPFTSQHALAVAWCVGVMALFIAPAYLLRGTPRERLIRGVWLAGVFAFQTWCVVYYMLPENRDLRKSLPLEVCDLAPWIGFLALSTRWRWARTTLFFWGLGLSTQAFFTPTLQYGPDHVKYFFFWLGHTQIVGAALYDIIVHHYRPAWRDCLVGCAGITAYFLVILPFNLLIDANYGYVGRSKPINPTIVDHLGPWPWRLLPMFVIVMVVFAGMTAITQWLTRWRDREPNAAK